MFQSLGILKITVLHFGIFTRWPLLVLKVLRVFQTGDNCAAVPLCTDLIVFKHGCSNCKGKIKSVVYIKVLYEPMKFLLSVSLSKEMEDSTRQKNFLDLDGN